MTFQIDPVFCGIMFVMLCYMISINLRLKSLQPDVVLDPTGVVAFGAGSRTVHLTLDTSQPKEALAELSEAIQAIQSRFDNAKIVEGGAA